MKGRKKLSPSSVSAGSDISPGMAPAQPPHGSRSLWSTASLLAIAATAAACSSPSYAANYTASNETELRNAITVANADPDPTATITLTGNVAIAGAAAFPAFLKPVTIDTGAFTLAGLDIPSGASNGGSLTFPGGALLTTSGAVRGGNADQTIAGGVRGIGGTGTITSAGSLTNQGSISGGIGAAGRIQAAGGVGGSGVNLTNSTLLNQGVIAGGQGGLNNANGSTGFGFTSAGGAGGTGLIMSGGSFNNQGQINGGAGGNVINTIPTTDHFTGGAGGIGAQLSGGTYVNSAGGTITGGKGGSGGNWRNTATGGGAGGAGIALNGGGTFTNEGSIVGGDGGLEEHEDRGGAGGTGAIVTSSTIINNGIITGGSSDGGRGINGAVTQGAGGTGLQLTGSTASNTGTIVGGTGGAINGVVGLGGTGLAVANSTIVNTGTVAGGTGGLSGATSAAGGTAITGTGGASVSTSGTISGGLSGNGLTRSNAVTFTNGGNRLELQAGYVINGNVVATVAGGDILALGGSTNSTFAASSIGAAAQYRNFSNYHKLGTSTWTLTGTTAATTSWQLFDGILSVSSDANLGSAAGTVTFNGGTLRNTTAFSTNRAITINAGGGTFETGNDLTVASAIAGAGALSKSGSASLILTAANTYTGGTIISAGTLQLGSGGATGSISGNVLNNGTLAFNRNNLYEFAGQISGSGAVTQIGTGTTTLTGNNTYTGTTTISAGVLQLGNGGTSGSIVGDIVNQSILAINRSNEVILPGNVSGSGRLDQVGTGTSILTGTNTYTGGTSITAGVLQVGNGGTSGSLVGNVTNNATIAFNRADESTFSAEISGTGNLNQIGTGTTVLTGTNTYTGGTTITAGALQLGNGGMTGSITGDVTNNGAFIFNRSNTYGFARVISGTGAVGQIGTGTTVLTGANTYTGGTVITAGTLQIGNGGTSGSIIGDVLNDGTLAFNRSDEITFGGVIGGSGVVNQIGTGTTILTGNNIYTGPTTISSGTLQIGNGGTSGQIIGPIVNNSVLAFNRSDAFLVPGAITGSGTVNQIGTGTTVLEGENTYTGGTNVTAGALRIGNGGTTGSIVGNVVNNGALEFFRSNQMTFAGSITGNGAINQIGSGLTNLTGDSSAFAGTTNVQAGTLAVNGSLCGNVNVLAGGRLQGTGTVCDTNNFAGGTIGPGNSIGTLTVAGNYTGNGGLLEIETVLGSDTSATDRLVVTGDTAGSTSVRVINRGGLGARTVEGIRIIDVGGASNGSFTLQGDYAFLGQQAVIAGAYAYLLQKNGVSTPGDGDWYLRSSLPTSTDGTPPPPGSIPTPPPPYSGPIFAPTVPVTESYARVMLSLNELPTMQQRIGHRFRSGPDAMASMGAPHAVTAGMSPLWARIEGGHKNLNPTATARSTLDVDHYSFEGGADVVSLETGAGRLLVGAVGNYVEGNADIWSLFGNGKVRVTGGGVGGTVTWLGDAGFYFDGQGRASWYNGDLTSAAIGSITSGNDGFGYAFAAEIGQRLGIGGGWSITPQLQVSYGRVQYDDFADRFGARVSLSNAESLLGRGGFSINHQLTWRDAAGQLVRSDVYGIANAHYEFMNGNSTLVSDTSFASKIDRLWGSVGAGGTFSWANDRYALFGEVSYNTSLEEAGNSYSYRGTAGFRVRW